MKKEKTSQQGREKGERFFSAGNFLLAKRAFEQVLRLEASEALQEKIDLCNKEIALQKRKETIKKGRRLEKRNQYSQALACFNQAFALEREVWLEKKISALKEKIGLEASSRQVAAAEASHDPTMALAAYDQALRLGGATPALIAKQGIALVRAERFKEATGVFSGHPPEDDAGRYYFGYALMRTGQFIKAFAQWSRIEVPAEEGKYDKFREHCEALRPFVLRALNAGSDSRAYGIVYQHTQKYSNPCPSPQQADDAASLKFHYIATLWKEARYTEIGPLLLPLPEAVTPPLLGFYARVYYQLAETDPDDLEMAVTFWLTAIHNDRLLQSLSTAAIRPEGGGTSEGLKIEALRAFLLQDLQALIDRHDREKRLPDSVKAHCHLEMRLIKQLAGRIGPGALPVDGKGLEIFPVTPVFADLFGLAETINAYLNEQKSTSEDENESLVEIRAYYSKAGRSLVLMEKGEEEAALALLPAHALDDLSAYCRQRISFRLAVRRIMQGEEQGPRRVAELLPLLQKYARYRDELCELAFSDLKPAARAGLSEMMERLGRQITDAKFRDAAAYIMSLHALELEMNITAAKKLLKRALALSPESDVAKTGLQEIQRAAAFDEINKAFKKQHLTRAVKIVKEAENPDLTDYFFETVGDWHQDTENWETQEKLRALRDFYAACRQVDAEHPLTLEIDHDIKKLELR